jgi:hypothetical protein
MAGERMTIALWNPDQAKPELDQAWRWVKSMLIAGHRLTMEIKPATRTSEQNARMWAMLADISRQVEWYGKRLSSEDWKHVFTASLRKLAVVPNLDGTGFVALGLSTSRMTKGEMSDLIELMFAFGAERGVQWSDPALPREHIDADGVITEAA